MSSIPVLVIVSAALSIAVQANASGGNLTWTLTSSRLPVPLESPGSVYANDGDGDSIYIVGGYNGTAGHDKIFKYSLKTGLVEVFGNNSEPLWDPEVLYSDGELTYFGGYRYPKWHMDPDAGYSGRIYRSFAASGMSRRIGALPETPYNGVTSAWDPVNKIAYIFGRFETWYSGRGDQVISYNPRGYGLIVHYPQVMMTELPRDSTYKALAVWDDRRQRAYLFQHGKRDIYQFEPSSFNFTTLSTLLPYGPFYPCAIYSNVSDAVYIISKSNLIKFSPATGAVETTRVSFWHDDHRNFACTFVPKLNRIYIFGGLSFNRGNPSTSKLMDEISYMDLDGGVLDRSTDPPTSTSTSTSTTTTTTELPTLATPTPTPATIDCAKGIKNDRVRLFPNPFCCESFFVCRRGRLTKSQCPKNQHFNPASLKCEDASKVGCRVQIDIVAVNGKGNSQTETSV